MPIDLIEGTTCGATARKLATLTTYGNEYKVAFFPRITHPTE